MPEQRLKVVKLAELWSVVKLYVGGTNSYILNSGVAEFNITKFTRNVQK